MPHSVSVIIPVGPGEKEWQSLVSSLKLPKGSEVLLAVGNHQIDLGETALPEDVALEVVASGEGRAGQMNAGAGQAANHWLWFLHADSQLSPDTLRAMERVVTSDRDGLFFFDLKFRNDGPVTMRINEWAVWFRAGMLKIPFGDQGFLIKRSLFLQLGGYREDLSYGEDHVFVWKVRQEGFAVQRAGGVLLTSARKYHKGGWLNVTVTHLRLTALQSVPQWLELIRRQVLRIFK